VVTLILSTVFGPLQAFLKTTSLDLQQWLICTGVALSVIIASEIRKAIRRRAATEATPAEPSLTAPQRLLPEHRAESE
jgi:Ca2+-transporting ATPase